MMDAAATAVLRLSPMELGAALALDLLIGDPASRWHPVAVFGRAMQGVFDRAPTVGSARQLAYGMGATLGGVGGIALGSAWVLRAVERRSGVAGAVARALLLKASLAYRQLEAEALNVARLIDGGYLPEAREALRALVSRDTVTLDDSGAASAAIESLAENLSDSLVAPLCFGITLGLPGALAYRAMNTLDAMVGYHGQYEYLGKPAARLDDVANLVPARLTAACIVGASFLAGVDWRGAFAVAMRDHAATASPNAGWPMAAMAGALGVRLEKVGHYRVGVGGRPPCPADVRRAVRVSRWVAILTGVTALLAIRVRPQ
ncbi:MAG: adenosylcobinamide-phosphate synthase [Chloroflexota bacterium]|nr:adenosylcobinamide-phosphate synthase [Chloroflexota bacterium]